MRELTKSKNELRREAPLDKRQTPKLKLRVAKQFLRLLRYCARTQMRVREFVCVSVCVCPKKKTSALRHESESSLSLSSIHFCVHCNIVSMYTADEQWSE